jgi:hypothetical protein
MNNACFTDQIETIEKNTRNTAACRNELLAGMLSQIVKDKIDPLDFDSEENIVYGPFRICPTWSNKGAFWFSFAYRYTRKLLWITRDIKRENSEIIKTHEGFCEFYKEYKQLNNL